MGSYLFKVAVYGMLLLFGLIGMFLGAVTGYAAWQSGALTITHAVDGRTVSTTVARAADAAAFWRSFAIWSLLPLSAGAAAVWLGRRGLSRL